MTRLGSWCRHSIWPYRRIGRAAACTLGMVLATVVHPPVVTGQTETQVALYVSAREVLFFSALIGNWTSIRLDAGERILQRGAGGNVAAVVTSIRAIGYSAILGVVHEIRVTEDETLEAFRVEGNVATVLTRLRALGFSAPTGKWADIQRFYPGR